METYISVELTVVHQSKLNLIDYKRGDKKAIYDNKKYVFEKHQTINRKDLDILFDLQTNAQI